MRKAVTILYRVLFIPVVLFAIFLLFFTVTEYKPDSEIELFIEKYADTVETGISYSSFIWNIGYAGLGANMDFFYDGGEGVRDTRENVTLNFSNISGFIDSNDSIDFILLQEVDKSSKRSYRINQVAALDSLLPDHQGFTGLNYVTGFVPVPLSSPLGKVKSGIVTYTTFQPITVIRYGFEGNYAWPKRLFMLKRCFLICTYPVNNGKFLHVVNIHNSAYDDGSLRAKQLAKLSDFAQEQYTSGNYVLFGGDWNQSPDGFSPKYDQPFDTINLSFLPEDFLIGWNRIYSDSVPSNRRIKIPYKKGETLTTVIDYYIASPNISVTYARARDLKFMNSDHQPLLIGFSLKE